MNQDTQAGGIEDRAEARKRAQECAAEIAEVLARFECSILPFIAEPEPVGRDGSKLIIQASYGVVPNPPTTTAQADDA